MARNAFEDFFPYDLMEPRQRRHYRRALRRIRWTDRAVRAWRAITRG